MGHSGILATLLFKVTQCKFPSLSRVDPQPTGVPSHFHCYITKIALFTNLFLQTLKCTNLPANRLSWVYIDPSEIEK